MHIGSLTVTIYLAEGSSLKDKRQVVKSLVETTRRKFNVSIAEVSGLDLWRKAALGVVVVSNDAAYCNKVLDKVLDMWEANPTFDIGDVQLEVL